MSRLYKVSCYKGNRGHEISCNFDGEPADRFMEDALDVETAAEAIRQTVPGGASDLHIDGSVCTASAVLDNGVTVLAESYLTSEETTMTAHANCSQAYAANKAKIEHLMTLLLEKLDEHDARFAGDKCKNWGHVGDLDHIQEKLGEVVAFIK